MNAVHQSKIAEMEAMARSLRNREVPANEIAELTSKIREIRSFMDQMLGTLFSCVIDCATGEREDPVMRIKDIAKNDSWLEV